MSLQLLDESSFSDSKMDISDATTSVESAGISPEFESKTQYQLSQLPQALISDNQNIVCVVQTNSTSPVNATEDKIYNENEENVVKSLDNRIMLPLSSLPMQQPSQRNAIARTLANSHPLMSPPGTDSDSEQSRDHSHAANGHTKYSRGQHYNFPDVVPVSEHLQMNSKQQIGPTPPHNKVSLLRTHSLDLLSSESEAEISQYHTTVEANMQSVALSAVPNTTNANSSNKMCARPLRPRKNGCDDISSLDSISNHSFDDDEDLEHNLASLSPTSSLADGLDDYDDEDYDDNDDEGPDLFVDRDELIDDPMAGGNVENTKSLSAAGQHDKVSDQTMPTTANSTVLPQYSAVDERRNSRNWQKVTLPDGRIFEIDMRVIEPYKRVLSHGGYLKAGGQNAIVIFCACHLPDRSRADYSYVMDNLFLYVVKTLEQLVTEDYVLIYLHGGSNRRNVPPFPWLKKCYQLLDRRLRKSLKNMYLVHPTFWVKSIVWMARPFVSVKFWRKLVYVKSLEELGRYVLVEKAAIPEKVKQYDAKHN